MSQIIKRKAFAYITHDQHVLVFRHVGMPMVGIQVPAGTVEPGEAPDVAALREAWEETGLPNLVLVRHLGEQIRDMRDFGKAETHHRFFFHLHCPHQPPSRWQHIEQYNTETAERPVFGSCCQMMYPP